MTTFSPTILATNDHHLMFRTFSHLTKIYYLVLFVSSYHYQFILSYSLVVDYLLY